MREGRRTRRRRRISARGMRMRRANTRVMIVEGVMFLAFFLFGFLLLFFVLGGFWDGCVFLFFGGGGGWCIGCGQLVGGDVGVKGRGGGRGRTKGLCLLGVFVWGVQWGDGIKDLGSEGDEWDC